MDDQDGAQKAQNLGLGPETGPRGVSRPGGKALGGDEVRVLGENQQATLRVTRSTGTGARNLGPVRDLGYQGIPGPGFQGPVGRNTALADQGGHPVVGEEHNSEAMGQVPERPQVDSRSWLTKSVFGGAMRRREPVIDKDWCLVCGWGGCETIGGTVPCPGPNPGLRAAVARLAKLGVVVVQSK